MKFPFLLTTTEMRKNSWQIVNSICRLLIPGGRQLTGPDKIPDKFTDKTDKFTDKTDKLTDKFYKQNGQNGQNGGKKKQDGG